MSWNPPSTVEDSASLPTRAEWLAEEAQQRNTDPSNGTADSHSVLSYTSAQEGPQSESISLEKLRRRNLTGLPREPEDEVPQSAEHPVQAIQEEWSRIQDELPPQISSR
jgi:hypothetical protein